MSLLLDGDSLLDEGQVSGLFRCTRSRNAMLDDDGGRI